MILAGALVQPIEEMIQEVYLNDAKKRLQECKELTIIGITGSYGKTSLKHILSTLLSQEYTTLMTPASYNNKMGITLTIRKYLTSLHEVFLCEMGADHVGEIKEMMQFVCPDIGVVTAIGPQHLQTFHSMEYIIKEKMQMVEQLKASGVGFLNADNEYIRSFPLRVSCKIIWFGKDQIADYRIGEIHYHELGTTFTIHYKLETYTFTTGLLGEHNVYNLCAGIAVAHTMGVSFFQLQKLVEEVPFVKHRLQIVSTTPYTLIDDAYNANPIGANNALEVLRAMPNRSVIITPGMVDLGSRQYQENYAFGRHMAKCVDEVILAAKCKPILEGLKKEGFEETRIHCCEDLPSAMKKLAQIVKEGDVVLLENDLPDAFTS